MNESTHKDISLSIELDAHETNNNPDQPANGFALTIGIFYLAVIFCAIFLTNNDNNLSKWLVACVSGNLAIGLVIYIIHENFNTRRYSGSDFNGFALKNIGNFAELLVYSFLLSFHLITLLAGVFIAKMVGDIGNPRNSSSIIGIYRLGIALQLILVIICAYYFSNSHLFHSIVHSKNFYFITSEIISKK